MSQYFKGLQNAQLNQQLLQTLQSQGTLAAAQADYAALVARQRVLSGNWVDVPSPPKPPPALPVSTQFGEIIAYRFWMYHRGFLRSASHKYVWMPGKVAGLMEGQKLSDHASCGIHAFKSQSDMLLEAYEGDVVFGTVKLWGDVIEYERGYHAEFASIVSLDHGDLPSLRKYQGKLMDELCARYIPTQEAK